MGSEDFADMMQMVPGAYFWIGHDGSVPVHNTGYFLDDKILPIGASMFARIIETRLPVGSHDKPAAEEEITSLHDLSVTDLIAGYRAKQFSPSEVLEEVIEHVAAWEPHIEALYLFDPDSAQAAAKASTDRWQRGEPAGTLDGIPVTVKDNIATKGQPVPLGAASVKLVPAEKDAPPAARLRESGAIIFAKTTMPDYGMLSSGLSSFHPLTRNPWDLTKNAGGSSSGAGAAGAAGYGPLHLGTDIGGWCGCRALVRPGRA